MSFWYGLITGIVITVIAVTLWHMADFKAFPADDDRRGLGSYDQSPVIHDSKGNVIGFRKPPDG